jgi:hypothetical protein
MAGQARSFGRMKADVAESQRRALAHPLCKPYEAQGLSRSLDCSATERGWMEKLVASASNDPDSVRHLTAFEPVVNCRLLPTHVRDTLNASKVS